MALIKLNASATKMGLGKGLPRPQVGVTIWAQGATAIRITQEVDQWGNVVDLKIPFQMASVIQPLTPDEIHLKPEGQWAWPWYWFHTKENVQLKQNDRIEYKGIEYKIMHVKDYSDYGHIEYHCIKDWQNVTTG